jgi:hypothetical protein
VSRHYHSAGASKCTLDGHQDATKAVDTVHTADAEVCQKARAMPRVSTQRSAGVFDPDDSAHRGECERRSGRRPVRAVMRTVPCAAISSAVRLVDVGTPVRFHDTSHTASCLGAQSEADVD